MTTINNNTVVIIIQCSYVWQDGRRRRLKALTWLDQEGRTTDSYYHSCCPADTAAPRASSRQQKHHLD